MARFSVGEDEMAIRKRKTKHPTGGPSKKHKNCKKFHSNEEEEVRDGDIKEEQEREEEDDDDDEEEEEAEGVGEGSCADSSNSTGVAVRIDTDVLDCSICYEPLRPPIFQCHNGHVACYSCCTKLEKKCHVCSHTIGYSRCLALEKVIESIRIPCSYAEYGCKRIVSYPQKDAHAERCIHAPCICPILDCTFFGSTAMLSDHFNRNHYHSAKTFWYDRPFKVSFEQTDPFLFLYGEDGHIFVIFNSNDVSLGHALSIACIRSSTREWEFLYKLTANNERNTLQMKASATNIRNILDNHRGKVFLMVPSDFFSSRKIFLDVCIQRIKLSTVI